jgi:hypothetical protein
MPLLVEITGEPQVGQKARLTTFPLSAALSQRWPVLTNAQPCPGTGRPMAGFIMVELAGIAELMARRAAMIEKSYRGVVEPATLVCGIRCSTGGTPPSAKITRYFAAFFRCCRTSR